MKVLLTNDDGIQATGLHAMLRAVAERFESGAIVASSTPGTSSSARRIACRPVAWIPSSLVSSTFIATTEDSPRRGALVTRP